MKIKFLYTVDIDVIPYSEYSESDTLPVYVDMTLDDIINYYYEKEYGKKYDDFDWYFEPGVKAFVKRIQQMYADNLIDEYKIAHELEKSNVLREIYKDLAYQKVEDEYDFKDIKESILENISECENLSDIDSDDIDITWEIR